ncbi:MAG: alpha/beta hydrolase [Pseudonocardiales bacterium]|nr:alpha/beta hydrolase [Pseudonocardiales bacterium]PZS22232.1 MAG: alpha/beta hydrolase [Pseudonocardiales bacterium]
MSRPPDPSSVRIPGPWTHREVSANGIRLHVAEAGKGPLVILLHGFPEFWWSWRHQLPALAAAGMRAVAVDLRGYGDSDKPPRGYDLWTLSGDVAGLVRALGERQADLVGQDWGGILGWCTAALHPRVVRSVTVLAAAHPRAMGQALLRDPAQRSAARYLATFQVPWLPERDLVRDGAVLVEDILRDGAGPRWRASSEFTAVARRYREAMLIPAAAHCALEYYRWVGRSQFRFDGRRFSRAVARAARVPVLQLHGAEDPYVLERTARHSAPWAGNSYRYEVLPGIGHFVPQEAPERTTELLTEFLRSS